MPPYTEDDSTADQYARVLDERYPKWDLYRAGPNADQAFGDWIVKLPSTSISGATIIEALRDAFEYIELPKYPRRPRLYSRSLFETFKRGGKWGLKYDGVDQNIHTKTKKAANEYADRFVAKQDKAHYAWLADVWPQLAGLRKGQDFVWV